MELNATTMTTTAATIPSTPTPLTDLITFSGYGVMVAVIGSIGNILSLAISLRPKLRGNSFSVFLAALACADTMVLWAQAFLLLTYHRVSPGYCISRAFFLMYPEAQANWIIAGLTIERAILISFPMKATAWGFGKLKSGIIIVGLIFLIILAFHIPTLFFFDYSSSLNACVAREELAFASGKLYPWMTVVAFFYLPMFLIVLCNVGIVRKLLAASTERAKFGGSSGSTQKYNRLRRISIVVTVVSAVYVMLEICNALIRTIVAAGDMNAFDPPPSFFGSMMACQTNHAINILLYCLTGDQFREEFFNLLRVLCCLEPAPKQQGTTMQSSSTAAKATTETTA